MAGGRPAPPPPDANGLIKAPPLRRTLSQVPITALAFSSSADYLLAGQDTDLLVYSGKDFKECTQHRILEDQPIHGVHVQDDQALVWGSSSVALVDLKSLGSLEEGDVCRATGPDWIYDGEISPFDPTCLILATAHNEVVVVRRRQKILEFGRVISPARPILYAAKVSWISEDCVLMAAGTAFGEILVWKCFLSSGTHQMLYVLTGHEGSIFGVDISSVTKLSDGRDVRLLATCSDDRTVRIWDISEREGSEDHDFHAPRETGFSATLPEDSKPEMDVAEPIAVNMGHLSRIWGVKMVVPKGNRLGDNGMLVYSFGEDATIQKWKLSIDSGASRQMRGSLKPLRNFSLHDGKHLSAHALAIVDGKHFISNGGADSKVSLLEESNEVETKVISPAIPGVSAAKNWKGMELIGRYDFITDDQLLLTTTAGRLFVITVHSGDTVWDEVVVPENVVESIKKCYAMKRTVDGNALLGSTNGHLYHYSRQTGQVTHIAQVSRKPVDITFLSTDGDTCDVLIHMFGVVTPVFYTLDASTGEVKDEIAISGIDERFLTVSARKIGDLLLLGSRHGYLSILRRGDGGYSQAYSVLTHTRDAITAIVPLPQSKDSDTLYILLTSRDGKYRIYHLENPSGDIHLHLRHESTPPLGPMIEGAWFTSDPTPQLILYGFRSKDFIAWNESLREECASVACGGAHRTYTIRHGAQDTNAIRFAFTKASHLSLYCQQKQQARVLKGGTHGMQIRGLTSNGKYIASGAEDTSIRIWSYDTELQPMAYIRAHTAGLQKLMWLGVGEDYLFSSGGNEEFFIWRVRKLDANYPGLGVVCEAVFGDKSADGDLRIMDFDVQASEDGIFISMVFSDSTLSAYHYTAEQGIQPLSKGSYTGACLTQIRHLKDPGTNNGAIITAATDGHISLWTTTGEGDLRQYDCTDIALVHQSCVKAMDIFRTDDGALCILTGGDDNALGLTIMYFKEGKYTIVHRGIIRNAHAAAINGLTATRRGTEILCITASNDQRIKLWRVNPQQRNISKLADVYSGVADPGDIAILHGDIFVAGVGLEAWAMG